MWKILGYIALVLLLFYADVPAQQPTMVGSQLEGSAAMNQQMSAAGGDSGSAPFNIRRILNRFEFWLSLLIVLFGTIVVIVQFSLLRKKSFDGNDILKVFGVTLIIVGTLFLIAAGFGDKQIAPAMGLFGTLAGYLLGKASGGTKNKAPKTPPS